ncbi:hypothetical protein PIB30_080654 [Stylosanthes scabra]|uniref:Uncharacterized protein n=1 Tax=Stylosanthes scabra TaxID=79078 RepID=A0ABU6VPZ2_9FABA|nr:hypothetical protein [Stylosanthes scabra]
MPQPSEPCTEDTSGCDSFYGWYLLITVLMFMASPLIGCLISLSIEDKIVAAFAVSIPYVMISIAILICIIQFLIEDHYHDHEKLTAQIEGNAEEVVTAPQPQVMVSRSTVVNETWIQISNNSNKELVTHKSSFISGGVTTNVTVPKTTEPKPEPKPKPDPHLPCGSSVGIAMVATKALPPVIS